MRENKAMTPRLRSFAHRNMHISLSLQTCSETVHCRRRRTTQHYALISPAHGEQRPYDAFGIRQLVPFFCTDVMPFVRHDDAAAAYATLESTPILRSGRRRKTATRIKPLKKGI